MIIDTLNLERSKILQAITESLDITPTQMQLAKDRYEAVGKFLGEEGSVLEKYNPRISPQGSFLLGTVVKPIADEDQFDIDLMCLLELTNEEVTQEELKTKVGDRLKVRYEKMMEDEKRRCWTIKYAESTKFHMDVLPCIPDPLFALMNSTVPAKIADTSIQITDKEDKDNYSIYSSDWNKSNPLGYYEWFKERMKEQFTQLKLEKAQIRGLQLDEVEDFEVRTPLQRVIQLLKRHRDIKYGSDDDRPISIIITTLAAKAYNGESDLYTAMESIVSNMQNHIERRLVNNKYEFWVENPINPNENFADKWNETDRKKQLFAQWLSNVKVDILDVLRKHNRPKILNELKLSFGERTINEATRKLGDDVRIQRESGNLMFDTSTGTLGYQGPKQVKQHQFYGDKS